MKYLEDLHHTTNSPHTRTLQTEKSLDRWQIARNGTRQPGKNYLRYLTGFVIVIDESKGFLSLFFAATEHRRESSSGEEKRKNDKRRRHQFSLPRSLRRFKIIFIQFSSDLYWIFLSNFSTCMCHVRTL